MDESMRRKDQRMNGVRVYEKNDTRDKWSMIL